MSGGIVRKKRMRSRAGHRGVVTKQHDDEAVALMSGDSPSATEVSRFIAILEEKLVLLRRLDGDLIEA